MQLNNGIKMKNKIALRVVLDQYNGINTQAGYLQVNEGVKN